MLSSKFITYFIDGFILKIKLQLFDYLLNENEHIYILVLDIEGEMHSIWNCGQDALNNASAIVFFKHGGWAKIFSWGQKI